MQVYCHSKPTTILHRLRKQSVQVLGLLVLLVLHRLGNSCSRMLGSSEELFG